jgi:hypothetical protein
MFKSLLKNDSRGNSGILPELSGMASCLPSPAQIGNAATLEAWPTTQAGCLSYLFNRLPIVQAESWSLASEIPWQLDVILQP